MQAVVTWKQIPKVFQQEEENLLDCCRRFKGLVERVKALHGKIEPVKAAKRDPKCSKDADKTLEETKNKMLAQPSWMEPEGRISLC